MALDKPPCRLFVIPARDAPFAIILRRGPSRWYHLIRWQIELDVFEPGAWFRGRIYEERCDLSPDGKLFVYICHVGAFRESYTSSWTAVSRAPWLHALALWPWNTTNGGGGRFLDHRRLVLHARMGKETHPEHPANGLEIVEGNADYHVSSHEVEDADWSGRDQQGHLIYCRCGKLFRRGKGRKALDDELADFNALRPLPQPAPNWARRSLC
jgi:hypothetical protein